MKGVEIAATTEEWVALLNRNFDKGVRSVDIATFNLSSSMIVKQWMDEIDRAGVKVRLLVGRPIDDRRQVPLDSIVDEYLSRYKRLSLRTLEDSHLKCWIFHRPYESSIILGGRNLTASEWVDVSVEIRGREPVSKVKSLFDESWKRGKRAKISRFMSSVSRTKRRF